ncbi:hypothetical protein ACFCW6_00350 [Streptomyces sp. NPDC056333]|uniref:hypothetical protein n=1 Tax=Streptomyces sp. NPDC056333 TaxID=3345786 RepID=UPI0035DEC268
MARQLAGDGTAPPSAAVLTVTAITLVAAPNHDGQIGASVFERGTGTVEVRARQGRRPLAQRPVAPAKDVRAGP